MPLLVTAALIRQGPEILVCRRRPEAHMGGLWEFPGGKLEPGEDPRACLARELAEELGVTAEVGRVRDVIFHRHDRFDLLLLVYEARIAAGRPQPLGCSEIRWVGRDELAGLPFPPADAELVAELAREAP